MMRKIIIITIILFSMPSLISAYNDNGMYRDGFKLNPTGNDINLMNRTIWNGTFDGTVLNVSTVTHDNTKANISGVNFTGKVNILNGSKLSIGEPFTTSTGLDDFQVARYNQNGVTMGFDLANINSTGNSRAIFRVSAGNITDLTGNPNLPFTVFSNTYAGTPSLVRATAYNALEYRVGIGSTPPTASNGTQANYTIWTGISLNGVSTVSEKAKFDGFGNMIVHNLAGSGNAYTCVDSSGKLYRGSPTC